MPLEALKASAPMESILETYSTSRQQIATYFGEDVELMIQNLVIIPILKNPWSQVGDRLHLASADFSAKIEWTRRQGHLIMVSIKRDWAPPVVVILSTRQEITAEDYEETKPPSAIEE